MKISDFDISTLAKILANVCSNRASHLCPMSNKTDISNCPFKDCNCMEIRMADWIEILNKED